MTPGGGDTVEFKALHVHSERDGQHTFPKITRSCFAEKRIPVMRDTSPATLPGYEPDPVSGHVPVLEARKRVFPDAVVYLDRSSERSRGASIISSQRSSEGGTLPSQVIAGQLLGNISSRASRWLGF